MTDDFEDEVRATMRDHDHEAPTAAALPDFAAADGPHLPTGGRYTWLPIAAAAAAVATLVGITFALGPGENRGAPTAVSSAATSSAAATTSSATTASLSCPAKYGAAARTKLWVPAAPQGVDGTARLAPDETPTHVVVCAYLHADQYALTGTKQLTGDLAAVTDTLTWQPKAGTARAECAAYLATSDSDNYLIGLTYGSATDWVSVPGDHCQGSSNGVFSTERNLRTVADAAYQTGRWVANDPTPAPCSGFAAGRLGQETAMVPDQPTGVTICTYVDGKKPIRTDRTEVRALVAALNALPTTASTQTCQGSPIRSTAYQLEFTYREGPPVWVRMSPSCTPSIDNGNLQASDSASVLPALTTLLK